MEFGKDSSVKNSVGDGLTSCASYQVELEDRYRYLHHPLEDHLLPEVEQFSMASLVQELLLHALEHSSTESPHTMQVKIRNFQKFSEVKETNYITDAECSYDDASVAQPPE